MIRTSVTIYTNRRELTVSFPARWRICSHCQGAGKSSSYLGAFTCDEWNEQDDDFRIDYMAGRYDQPCNDCAGLGRVLVIDRKSMSGWRHRILLKAFDDQQRDLREMDAMEKAERRMGA